MYKTNLDNLIDKLFDTNLPSQSWKTTFSETKEVDYVYHIEDNQIYLSVDVVGHDPKNISLEVTTDQIIVKSAKPDTACSLVQDIDFIFKLGKDYDGTKSEAKFDNGLLVITISKKEETKTKKLSINIR
ncbi:MAG: Hsp20/alpha crystallin family [Bacteroidota bacterium]